MPSKPSLKKFNKKIFHNTPERADDTSKEKMDVSRAGRMKDVHDAQQRITRISQDMERKGKWIIIGKVGERFPPNEGS